MNARTLSALVFAALLLHGCASHESLVPGEDVSLNGRVTAIDVTPMFVDGDGLLTIESSAFGVVTIRIAARETLCPARGLDVFQTLSVDDRVSVVGTVTESRVVRPCTKASHLLERLE